MTHDISIKELRMNLSDVADRAEKGETFRVIRRSKPSFVIMKVDTDAEDGKWDTVVDFTDDEKTAGMFIKDVMKLLKKYSNDQKRDERTYKDF